MKREQGLSHDHERRPERWLAHVQDHGDLPVLDRVYRAAIVLLISSGLRGIHDVKTAEIARLAGINESTLFRHARKRDQLVADAINWCWEEVNQRIAAAHYASPKLGADACVLMMSDLTAFLELFDDDTGRLVGTGAMLSFRRAEELTAGYDCPAQLAFRERLELLASALPFSEPDGADGAAPTAVGRDDETLAVIATYLTNFLSTIWFSWLSDPASREPGGVLAPALVRRQLTVMLKSFVHQGDAAPDDPRAGVGGSSGSVRPLWAMPGA